MSIFALTTISVNAKENVGTVLYTSCGKEAMTVAPEFFDNFEEYVKYLNDLNYDLCEEDGNWYSETR